MSKQTLLLTAPVHGPAKFANRLLDNVTLKKELFLPEIGGICDNGPRMQKLSGAIQKTSNNCFVIGVNTYFGGPHKDHDFVVLDNYVDVAETKFGEFSTELVKAMKEKGFYGMVLRKEKNYPCQKFVTMMQQNKTNAFALLFNENANPEITTAVGAWINTFFLGKKL